MSKALTMTGKADIIDRLSAACVGQPAEIGWPHYVLHDAITEIETLRTALADMTRQRDEARRLALMEAAKIAESRIGIYETMRQNPVFAGMIPMFDAAEDEQRITADTIRALAEGAKP